MCNYSLEFVRSREAVEGERLVTRRFYVGSLGFVSAHDPDLAVCLRGGTQLVLRDIPLALQQRMEVPEEAVARFAFLVKPRRWWDFWSLDVFDTDGLVFENGKSIHISRLPEGLIADVLSTHFIVSAESEKQAEAAQASLLSDR